VIYEDVLLGPLERIYTVSHRLSHKIIVTITNFTKLPENNYKTCVMFCDVVYLIKNFANFLID
jgi:hypothetical protein